MLETVIPLHYQDESFDVYKRICNNNRGAANALWRFAIITFISSYGARSFAPKALRIFRRGDIFSAPNFVIRLSPTNRPMAIVDMKAIKPILLASGAAPTTSLKYTTLQSNIVPSQLIEPKAIIPKNIIKGVGEKKPRGFSPLGSLSEELDTSTATKYLYDAISIRSVNTFTIAKCPTMFMWAATSNVLAIPPKNPAKLQIP